MNKPVSIWRKDEEAHSSYKGWSTVEYFTNLMVIMCAWVVVKGLWSFARVLFLDVYTRYEEGYRKRLQLCLICNQTAQGLRVCLVLFNSPDPHSFFKVKAAGPVHVVQSMEKITLEKFKSNVPHRIIYRPWLHWELLYTEHMLRHSHSCFILPSILCLHFSVLCCLWFPYHCGFVWFSFLFCPPGTLCFFPPVLHTYHCCSAPSQLLLISN